MIWRSQSPISSQHQLLVAAERSSCQDTEETRDDEKDVEEEDCSVQCTLNWPEEDEGGI